MVRYLYKMILIAQTMLSCVVKLKQTTVIYDIRYVLVTIEFQFSQVIIQLKIHYRNWAIYRGWAFCPKWWAFCPHMGQDAHFCVKFIKSFYFYHIFHDENICMSRIRGVLGHELVSKISIHWLSKYEHDFLGWASCPTLPYLRVFQIRNCSNRLSFIPMSMWPFKFIIEVFGTIIGTIKKIHILRLT